MPENSPDKSDEAVRARRRAALERAAHSYPDVPDDVADVQVGKAEFGAELLGGDAELTDTAVAALEHNLQSFHSAVDDGAQATHEDG